MITSHKSSNKEILTPDEIERLTLACGDGALGARNKALIMVLWKCGIRRSEACSLVPADLNWKENKIRIRQGKGGVDDFSILPNSVRPYVDAWMVHREKLGIKKSAPLFCATSKNKGRAILPSYIFNRLQTLGKKAGINKNVHPHMLRRSCATQMVNMGYDITEVQSQLRHKSTHATHHYLVIANKAKLAEKMADTW